MDPVGLARVALLGALGALLHGEVTGAPALAAEPPIESSPLRIDLRIDLWADRDDDDANGVPDAEQGTEQAGRDPLPPAARVDLVPLDRRLAGAVLVAVSGGEHARVILPGGRAVSWGHAVPAGAWLQGLTPGRAELTAGRLRVTVDVRGVEFRDGQGTAVDPARSHASIDRAPPVRFTGGPDSPYDDFDALRIALVEPAGPPGEIGSDRTPVVEVESVNAAGVRVDVLPKVVLAPSACLPAPASSEPLRCWASAPLRFVMDDVDRNHPLGADRSLKAEVGGAIVVREQGRKAQMLRVLGPRESPVGAIGRLRASVRPFVVRVSPGGAPSIGGTDAGAVEAVRAELAAAAAIWGQCGLTFGDTRALDVRIVDPPPSHLIALGDDLGLPASGGELRLRADGKSITVPTGRGEGADTVARRLARAIERAGLVAVISTNARIGPGIEPGVDVSVRRKDGSLVAVDTPPGLPLSTDATLGIRIGSVDMSDGLQHFTDVDAMAGTLEERTLLKAIDDDDPGTIEIVVVPLFAGGGRIGESFIGSDLSSVRNVVLVDRAGIRARKSSLTVAHELGHVLMDLPGHPDDYGADTPTQLMDSDAADSSPFGPRRLTLEECARVVRQAGPDARMPLLTAWPITPIPFH
jgi:hypothetical protein